MNSSLPNLLASPAATPTAGGVSLLNPAALASLPGATATGTTPATPAPEFATLLGGDPAAPAAPAGATVLWNGVLTASAATVTAPVMAPAPTKAPDVSAGADSEVPTSTRQQAVALALALLQGLRPDLATPTAEAAAGQPAGMAASAGGRLPEASLGTVLPGDAGQSGAVAATPAGTMPNPSASFEAAQAEALAELPIGYAADGAIELNVALPDTDAPLATPAAVEDSLVAVAEVDLPGDPRLRVQLASAAALQAPSAGRENFAVKPHRENHGARSGSIDGERNFENAEDKGLVTMSSEAGIAVAQKSGIMPAAPTEEIRATQEPQNSTVLPVRADFQVAQAPAERITAPASGPAGQTFATRAVETVRGLVEAQFSASMQRSGSVQLRLKFGGEDLSVRVAIRGGVVHTDFQTDSSELRAAIQREWQAVAAASPAEMQRFADPVFAPAAVRAEASMSGQDDASRHFSRSSAQDQADFAQQQQQQRSSRLFAEPHAFNRRSLLSESFVPEAPTARVAMFLPTSRLLSALA